MNESEQLEQAIAALEDQRAGLGDTVVDAAQAPLRDKLAALTKEISPPDDDGQPVSDASSERRIVTVLFCDVTGSTSMAEKLDPEERAPDSIQFNLVGLSEDETRAFADAAAARGVKVQVFGMSADNARAFWNWNFLPGEAPELPKTRAMLMKACDTRLPARLTRPELDLIAEALVMAARDVMGEARAYGT